MLKTGARPNGAAIIKRLSLGIVACIGDDRETPTLHAFSLAERKLVSIGLPGRPGWCVADAEAKRVFLCIREPSMVLVASLPDLRPIAQCELTDDAALMLLGRTVNGADTDNTFYH